MDLSEDEFVDIMCSYLATREKWQEVCSIIYTIAQTQRATDYGIPARSILAAAWLADAEGYETRYTYMVVAELVENIIHRFGKDTLDRAIVAAQTKDKKHKH